jgi:palmitoyltransferase ZDHHC9/14/18
MTTTDALTPTRLSDGLPLVLTVDDGDGTVVSDSMTDYEPAAGGGGGLHGGQAGTNGMNIGGTLGRSDNQEPDSTRPTGSLPYPNPNRLSQHLQLNVARNSVASIPASSIHGTPRNSMTPGIPPLQTGQTSTAASGVSRPSTAASSSANTFGRWEPQPPIPPPPPRWGSPPAEEQKARNGSVSMRGFPGRPESSASKSHVPSITSHAFLRPMSSAKLQAQRGRHMDDHDMDEHGGSQDGSSGYAGYPLHPPGSMNRSSRLRHGSLAMADVDENGAGLQLPHPAPITTSFDGGLKRDTFNSMSIQDREQYTARSISQSPTPNTMRSMHSGASDLPLHSPALNIPPTSQSNGHHSDSSRMDGNSTGHSNPHASTTDLAQSSSKRRRKKEKRKHIRTQDGEDEEFIGWNFEAFPGNTVFCFWGRCQTARDHPMNVLTAILVLLPTGLFFGYSGPWLWRNLSPALPITFAYLFLICFSSFIKAAVSDPGVSNRLFHFIIFH